MVGEGEPLDPAIRRFGLDSHVRRTGFVEDDVFRQYLAAIDGFVNLRYPSHSESSASLIQAMSLGKPCVVTDHAWFAELPDATVAKVPYDEREIDALVAVLGRLPGDAAYARALGEQARAYVEANHAPAAVARHFVEVLAAPPSDARGCEPAFIRGRAGRGGVLARSLVRAQGGEPCPLRSR